MNRPNWDEYFMAFANLARTRSTCVRRGVGAVIVKENRIMATGYNGTPQGITHCEDEGCLRAKLGVPSGQRAELCRGLHAEQNAIIQAAHLGQNIDGSVLYCTTQPCSICSKMIVNAGIKRIVIAEPYPDELGEAILKEAGITVDVVKMPENLV